MTTAELKSYLEEKNIQPGDKVRILYSFISPTWMKKEILSSSLIRGGRTINTKTGPLRLPEDDEYLILYSEMEGVTGITAKYIDIIEIDGKGPMTPVKFNSLINREGIKAGDRITLVMVDNEILSNFKLLRNDLVVDEEREILVCVELSDGTQEYMYLNTISEIRKMKN
jgi:hypothetical protein